MFLTGALMAGTALFSYFGSRSQSKAANKASDAQAKADADALEFAKEQEAFERLTWAEAERRRAPWRAGGKQAQSTMNRLMSPGGWNRPPQNAPPSRAEQIALAGADRLGPRGAVPRETARSRFGPRRGGMDARRLARPPRVDERSRIPVRGPGIG